MFLQFVVIHIHKQLEVVHLQLAEALVQPGLDQFLLAVVKVDAAQVLHQVTDVLELLFGKLFRAVVYGFVLVINIIIRITAKYRLEIAFGGAGSKKLCRHCVAGAVLLYVYIFKTYQSVVICLLEYIYCNNERKIVVV